MVRLRRFYFYIEAKGITEVTVPVAHFVNHVENVHTMRHTGYTNSHHDVLVLSRHVPGHDSHVYVMDFSTDAGRALRIPTRICNRSTAKQVITSHKLAKSSTVSLKLTRRVNRVH